jgi:hypothetical protein
MTCTALCTALLPPQAPLYIETMVMTERGMTLDVAVTTSQAHCPTCTQPSTHMHRIFPPHFAARQAISEGYLNSCSIM